MNPQEHKSQQKPNTPDKKDGYLNYQWSKGYLPTVNPKQDETLIQEERYK